MSDGRTVWWPKDAAWWRREHIVELGEEFGADGPAVLDWLSCEAKAQNMAGTVKAGYRSLARGCFVGLLAARTILYRCAELGVITEFAEVSPLYFFRCRVVEFRPRRGYISAAVRALVMRRDRFTCQRCGWVLEAIDPAYDGSRAVSGERVLELDHVQPLARGGHDGSDNLQALCRPCNRRKATKT